jgi:hypothetical protein
MRKKRERPVMYICAVKNDCHKAECFHRWPHEKHTGYNGCGKSGYCISPDYEHRCVEVSNG